MQPTPATFMGWYRFQPGCPVRLAIEIKVNKFPTMFGQFCSKKEVRNQPTKHRTKRLQQQMTPSTVIVALSGSFVRIQSCQINGEKPGKS